MKSKKAWAGKGAERLASIIEAHLGQLSHSGRAKKVYAFHEAVAKVGARAKSGGSRSTCSGTSILAAANRVR
jgi:hypothetical protein